MVVDVLKGEEDLAMVEYYFGCDYKVTDKDKVPYIVNAEECCHLPLPSPAPFPTNTACTSSSWSNHTREAGTGASPFFTQPEMGSVQFRLQTMGRRPLPSAARVRPASVPARTLRGTRTPAMT